MINLKATNLNRSIAPGKIERDTLTKYTKHCSEPIRRIAREADKRTRDTTIPAHEIREWYEQGGKDLKTAEPYIKTFGTVGVGAVVIDIFN